MRGMPMRGVPMRGVSMRGVPHALTHLPVIRVAENVFGTEKHHRSYGVMIIDWIIFLMKHRRELRRRMYARSEVWKSGAKLTRPANYTIADFDDGTVFPQHPFAQPMVDKPGQPIEVRVALMKGTDDLELNNPLGVARGTEKQACTYGCVGNLAPEERFAHENMCIMLMCPQKVIAELGPVRVFSGANPLTGQIIPEDWASPGAQLRAGMEGIECKVNIMRAHVPMFAYLNARLVSTCVPRIAGPTGRRRRRVVGCTH